MYNVHVHNIQCTHYMYTHVHVHVVHVRAACSNFMRTIILPFPDMSRLLKETVELHDGLH